MNEKDFLRAFQEMRRWVARERRRLRRTGERPSQTYLRRSRLAIDTDPRSVLELLRELRAFSGRGPRR